MGLFGLSHPATYEWEPLEKGRDNFRSVLGTPLSGPARVEHVGHTFLSSIFIHWLGEKQALGGLGLGNLDDHKHGLGSEAIVALSTLMLSVMKLKTWI